MGDTPSSPTPTFANLEEFNKEIGSKYKNFEEFKTKAPQNAYGKYAYQIDPRGVDSFDKPYVTSNKFIGAGEVESWFARSLQERLSNENLAAADRLKANAARDAQRKSLNKSAASAVAGAGASKGYTALTQPSSSIGLGLAQGRTVLGG